MASAPATKRMREEATCPICLNLMAEPLSVSCGHSYCKRCIEDFMDSYGHRQQPRGTYHCPQCRAPFHRKSLRPNKQLGSLIEAVKELNLEIMCKKHGEQLHLFCEDEGELICWRCERSPQHKGHVTMLVEDASPAYKKELQEAVTSLRELEKQCMNWKAFETEQITEWNRKVALQRQKIQADFKDLHSFLQEEEKSYLWKLEQEKEKTLKVLSDNETSLVLTTSELESHIQDLEDRCQGSAQKLLQDVKDALSRSRALTLEKPEAPSLEIQTVCDVSELYFDVTRMLRDYQVNVTLDPETAHCGLMVSVDQRQVTTGVPQHDVGKSCGRFTAYPCILGREGFTSGRHYFEVYVGEGTQWEVGVCRENVRRDIRISLNPQSGFWGIRLCREDGYEALTSPPTTLPLPERPLLVGVFLDYEAGAVSFYNMTTASHIFTFPRTSFLEKLRPYFQVYPCSPLFLPPPDK